MGDYNYAKIETKEGELVGYISMEIGTENEISVSDYIVDNGYVLVKSTKEEYDNADEGFDAYDLL